MWITLSVIPFILLLSCNNVDKFSSALEQAGSNKNELLKVIDHYKRSPADTLKLWAAYFLIENMPYHFSYDTTYLYKYRPVIKKIHSLKITGLPARVIKERVNPIMDSLAARYPLSYVYSLNKKDITYISSDYLIRTIDQSFHSYNSNPFKDSILFDDFLDYALPYRVQNGYSLEEWRPYLTSKYALGKAQNFSMMLQLCDSLLSNFREVKLGWRIADKFPYLKLNDYMQSMTTHCPQRCWFNCLLLRSFGIPAAIDFVPTSRVHPAGHEWNSIILKNTFHVLEPFWQDSLRYLKPFYSRDKSHPQIGPIEFPKIYRKTFKINSNELLKHAVSSGEEIPSLFRNPFIKDVTAEYFKTFGFESHILKKIEKQDYAYACVIDLNSAWCAVDFGKIKNGKIFFRSMGTNNVYLPAYYKFNSLIPAAYPVLLNKDGSTFILRPDSLHAQKINITHTTFQRPDEYEYKQAFIGAAIEGSNNRNFKQGETLYRFSQSYEPGTYRIPIKTRRKYRYVRLVFQKSKTILHEISFFNTINGIEKDVRGRLINSNPADSLFFHKIVDKDLLTGTVFTPLSEGARLAVKFWVGYDFKKPTVVSAFEFYFVLSSNFKKGGTYELLYWDFGWKTLGQKKIDSIKFTSFDKVPKNALLLLRNTDTGNYCRIFTYSDGKQHWY